MSDVVPQLLLACALSALVGFGFLFAASAAQEPLRKKRHRTIGFLLLGLALSLGGGAEMIRVKRIPALQVTGIIRSISPAISPKPSDATPPDTTHPDAPQAHPDTNHRTDLVLGLPSGATIPLHTSDDSPLFHAGERIEARYEAATGRILHAQFFAADGHPEGDSDSNDMLLPDILIPLGLLVMIAGWGLNNRKPKTIAPPRQQEQPTGRSAFSEREKALIQSLSKSRTRR